MSFACCLNGRGVAPLSHSSTEECKRGSDCRIGNVLKAEPKFVANTCRLNPAAQHVFARVGVPEAAISTDGQRTVCVTLIDRSP